MHSNPTLSEYYSKYFLAFENVFEVNPKDIRKEIDTIIFNFLEDKIELKDSVEKLGDITGEYEYIPFNWILKHVKIDYLNFNFTIKHFSKAEKLKVYKIFDKQDYGFNMLSDIYERISERVGVMGTRPPKSKIFRLSSLIENEKKQSKSDLVPKISTTIFHGHKYQYNIYDSGMLMIFNEGEVWSNEFKRYIIPAEKSLTRQKRDKLTITHGTKKVDHYYNIDGSITHIDNEGNEQIEYCDGRLLSKLANGSKLIEYADGSIDKISSKGKKQSFDFEGNPIIKKNIFKKIFNYE